MREKIILKKNARQRLELTNTDLKLLAFLEQQRLLTLQQLYQAAKHLFEAKIEEYSFKNRIRKLEEYRLIRGEHYSEGFHGERFKYLCIGSKAIDLLIDNSFLDQEYNKSKIYKFSQKKNIMHFLATQQAAINLLTKLNGHVIKETNTYETKHNILYNVTSFSHSPGTFPYTEWIRKERNLHRQNIGAYHARIAKHMTGNSTGIRGTTMTIVQPDWIVKIKGEKDTRDAFINIEMDMGTEPLKTLTEKVFKYAILAEKNPDELHIMNIVIADNSFSKRSKFSNGIKRARNIAMQITSDVAVVNRIKESGLMIKASPLKNTSGAVYLALKDYS